MSNFTHIECSVCGNILELQPHDIELQNMPNFYLHCDCCDSRLKIDKEDD